MYRERIATQEQIQKFFTEAYGHREKRIFAYYISNFDKIIMEERLMLLPIDDRMAIRGHGVFDVIYIKKLKLINVRISLFKIKQHIQRLLESARDVHIKHTFSAQTIQRKTIQTCGAVFDRLIGEGESRQNLSKRVMIVRLQISSGYGDFGISSLGKQPIFSIIVSEPFINYEIQKQGVKQFVVLETEPKQFVHSKTVNYTENALMANLSKEKGGYIGIKMTKNHIILEASIANVAFVFGKEFATPRFQTVIRGTTIIKCIQKLQHLKTEGIISQINFRDISIQQAYKANEILIIGGDKIVPVLELDGHVISKQKGVVATILQEWYQQWIQKGIQIPFQYP